MGIQSYVMGIHLLFCNDFIYCILNLLIRQWCTVTIISICYGPEQFRIVFISWGCHALSFARCVKFVQNIPSTFKYVEMSWILKNWIICNRRFLVLCLIPWIFFFVYAFVDELWFAFLRRTFRFSLIKIVFSFSLCVLGIWLKVSIVTWWASKVVLWASIYSSVMTLFIASWTLSLDNGAPLQLFQSVMVLNNFV